MSKKLITNEFIERANKVHNFKYDYSELIYINSDTKVSIICPEHGEFLQIPHKHLSGSGCPKCANINRANKQRCTVEHFIRKAKNTHGNKYDYSKVYYTHKDIKVSIICPVHGEFTQTPNAHLRGQGCPKCANRHKYTTVEWIEKAKVVHGSRYNYDKVEYKGNKTKVIIICTEHGEFLQSPVDHLLGKGCPKCCSSNKLTTEEFIEKAKKIHGGKYNYSKVNYKNTQTKVCIICPEHGSFFQIPNSHLNGSGCPKCNISKLEKEIIKYCDNHKIEYIHQYRNKWLKKQSLDFYFPKFNVGVECQGIQHFKPIEFFGNEKGFKYIQKRDIRKNKLCKDNGIKLLYFTKEPYSEFLNEPLYKDTESLFNETQKNIT